MAWKELYRESLRYSSLKYQSLISQGKHITTILESPSYDTRHTQTKANTNLNQYTHKFLERRSSRNKTFCMPKMIECFSCSPQLYSTPLHVLISWWQTLDCSKSMYSHIDKSASPSLGSDLSVCTVGGPWSGREAVDWKLSPIAVDNDFGHLKYWNELSKVTTMQMSC